MASKKIEAAGNLQFNSCPITKQPWLINHSSFVRNVVDVNLEPLSEVNLLALRGHRVQVRVHADYWAIVPIDEG